ncbi:MAG: XdhC/CoxI family protein [Bacteroidetes bacterium]|nr:MAG: XdhC/CoxI family protein [Bacteroidota bacterium]
MKNIYLQIPDHYTDNSPLILATVTRTIGSTPQKPGSSALFGRKGLISGTVGGGIVEAKVQKSALDAIHTKKSGHFHFNLANDISKTEEAICGGQISVLVDANLKNHFSVLEQIKQSMADRIPGVLITMVTDFTEKTVLINRYWMSEKIKPSMPAEFLEKIEPLFIEMISSPDINDYRELELSIPGEEPSSLFLLEPVFPPAHLIIGGAGHIGKALAHLGNLLDFEVTVIDDRSEYANSENIPDASHIIVKDIGAAFKEIEKRSDSYVVIVTRGHKDDAAALKPCIGSGLAYTGMIGSKKKVAAMRMKFIENKWATSEEWNKIHAPIGLEIKSQTVEEIAVSIAAQLVLVRNSRKTELLSKK